MTEKQKILIVDDDENIANLVALYLAKECFDTCIAGDGDEALSLFSSYKPDLILLDLMLPGTDGNEVCRRVRKTSDVPIIMMSAKSEVFDKVLGLELGADDYVIKPFDSKELVARVKAVLRRYKKELAAEQVISGAMAVSSNLEGDHSAITNYVVSPAASSYTTAEDMEGSTYVRPTDPKFPRQDVAHYDELTIDLSNYSVTYCGKAIEMPPKELELLYFLASHPNQVFTREQLLDHIWGYEYIGDTRTVDVHIKRLREKIKKHENWNIATVWGIGYKFDVKKQVL